jgi:glycopeptide antibiotics resistance protein
MVTLPRVFRRHDTELHALFYLGASLVIYSLFPRKWGILTVGLFLFGLFIEKAQEYSNRLRLPFIGRVIHGRADMTDVKYNLLGILLGLVIFHSYQIIRKSKV